MHDVKKNHAWVEGPLKVQDKSVDFEIAEQEKFIDMISIPIATNL